MYLGWFVRFSCGLLVLLTSVGQVLGITLGIAHVFGGAILSWQYALMVIGQVALLVYGMVFLPRTYKCQSISWLRVLRGVLWSWVDLFTFIIVMMVSVLIIRVPYGLWKIEEQEGDFRAKWRRFVGWQLLMSGIDWLLVPFVLSLVLQPWRLTIVWSEWKLRKGKEGDQRLMLLEQWVKALLDIPLLALFL